ncbi:UNVERIFIED_CONTAM: hypothetical protein GTU68_015885 [Idotea baltica]|nr:hypothetical protein [Idotea baltica]
MSSSLPITIIGGYLGSGKTTLVNHLLRHANGVRLAVLVNDFGDLPIDADLIEAQEGDVISLSGGCVCCSYGDDLSLSLQKLQEQEKIPEHIFIEASGVALPGAIGNSLSLLRAYQLEGVVVLADAATIVQSAAEKYIGDTIERQLSDADLILLNKLDLITEVQLVQVHSWLDEHYSHAPCVDAIHGTIEPEILFDIKRENARSAQNDEHVHKVSNLFSTVVLKVDQVVDAKALAELLAHRECNLVRAKGFVLDKDDCMKTIQVVGRRWSVTDAPVNVRPGIVCISSSVELDEEKIRTLCKLERPVTA